MKGLGGDSHTGKGKGGNPHTTERAGRNPHADERVMTSKESLGRGGGPANKM